MPRHAQHETPPGSGHSHSGHAHSHAGPPPAGLRGARALRLAALALVLATLAGLALLWPSEQARERRSPFTPGERTAATVTDVDEVPCGGPEGSAQTAEELVPTSCARVGVRVDAGPDRGTDLVLDADAGAFGAPLEAGDGVVLLRAPQEGLIPEERYQLVDRQRGAPLALLAALFGVAVVALGRWKGLTALVGLAASVVVLTQFLLPALLDGRSPVLVAAVGASAVMCVVIPLSHGFGVRSATALLGTGAALLVIVGLSQAFVVAAGLSGLSSDEASFVRGAFTELDPRGLLLAGFVVGALGILDDVTVTQVSTVWELRAADPSLSRRALYAAALRVGRDHVAATVNTLLLAYAGAALPLLLVFSTTGEGLAATLTNALVGEEIVRALVGSIGLVAAVPLTTALAAASCPPPADT